MPILIVDDYLTVEVGSANDSKESRSLGWVAQKIAGGHRKISSLAVAFEISVFHASKSLFEG